MSLEEKLKKLRNILLGNQTKLAHVSGRTTVEKPEDITDVSISKDIEYFKGYTI